MRKAASVRAVVVTLASSAAVVVVVVVVVVADEDDVGDGGVVSMAILPRATTQTRVSARLARISLAFSSCSLLVSNSFNTSSSFVFVTSKCRYLLGERSPTMRSMPAIFFASPVTFAGLIL